MVKNRLAFLDGSLLLITFLSVWYSLYMILLIAPEERTMGSVQKIFYFHVASAINCYVAIGLLLLGSILYLASPKKIFDCIAHASSEVAFMLASIVLVTGMIWGHAAWNTWFRFEPRLITFLLLWLILFSIQILRMYGDRQKIPTHSAILGIVGAITVPLMVYSITLLPASAQLHPQVLAHNGLKDPLFTKTLTISIWSLFFLTLTLIRTRYRMILIEEKLS